MLYRTRNLFLLSFLFCSFALATLARADEQATVRLPLSAYDRLISSSQEPKKDPRPAPSSFALGPATLAGLVSEREGNLVMTMRLNLEFDVLEDEWTSIPLLPAGVSIVSATIDGKSTRLTTTPQGLAWNANKSGHYEFSTEYKLPVRKSDSGYSVSVPTPQAASIAFSGKFPKASSEIAFVPSTGTETQDGEDNFLYVRSTIPSSTGFQITWRSPLTQGYSISRAEYLGVMKTREEVITWSGILNLELSGKDSINVDLLPQSSTISEVLVDDKAAAIFVEAGHFKTQVKGQGAHKVRFDFQTAIQHGTATPQVQLNIPSIPISHLQLLLPERKELSVTPFSPVSYEERKDGVLASVFVPMSNSLSLSWTEAIPEEIKEELRANARYVHTLYAEEGVLYGKVHANYEITRGKSSVFEMEIPKGIQINRIHANAVPIADWRVLPGSERAPDLAQIFLEHEITGSLDFDVDFDQSISSEQGKDTISVPFLRAHNVHRQQGMLALLTSKDVGLKPVEEQGITKVGENLLPAGLPELQDKSISHTYKYGEMAPTLKIQTAKPQRREGRFDAVVNSLLSLSDVAMSGTANVEISIKSGSINELHLELPNNLNILSLTAPSLRAQKTEVEGEKQFVDIQFTQEMEGQFRVELAFEKILSEKELETITPNILVKGADIQQGKLAVQALSAVEIQASTVEQLSTLDPAELPQQLLLKTSNPILLAYSYVRSDPPYRLGLKMTRHKELDIQSAAIDKADYTTLYTPDGIAITTARFEVRNSRQQFLRVTLPPGAEVWSAAVDNVIEKPALANEGKVPPGVGPQVLLKIITSARSFPVELVYQNPVARFGIFGTLQSSLPLPDMVVTNSEWSLFLPEDFSYGDAETNMKTLEQRQPSPPSVQVEPGLLSLVPSKGSAVDSFRISVPTSGVRFRFAKLYANQAGENAHVAIPYRSGKGKWALKGLIILIAAALILGLRNLSGRRRHRALILSLLVLGSTFFGTVFHLQSDIPLFCASLLVMGAFSFLGLRDWRPVSRETDEESPTTAASV